MENIRIKMLIKPTLLFTLLVLVMIPINFIDYSWSEWEQAACLPSNCFCERVGDGLIRQPSNAWTSLFFVWLGLFVIAQGRVDAAQSKYKHTSVRIRAEYAYPLIFGVACILMGLTSFFFHASLTFIGQTLDVSSMYLVVNFMLLYSFARLQWMSTKTFILCYFALMIGLGCIIIVFPVVRRYIFALTIFAALISEVVILLKFKPRMELSYLYVTLASFSVGFVAWVIDNEEIICFPDSWFHGHTIWHIMTPVAVGAAYLYYRSESSKQTDVSKR